MNDQDAAEQERDLVFEYELDAPVHKVWRAISISEFRNRWLPTSDLVDEEPVSCEPGEEVSYKMKDDEPPFLLSEVTFQVHPNDDGGTILRIIHRLTDERVVQDQRRAANNNSPCLMQAA
ncbi:MAG: polyketide cyclase [Stappiaceae bacterium]